MKSIFLHRHFCILCVCVLLSANAWGGEVGGPLVAGALIGGTRGEHITGTALLANGDIVVCGWSESNDIPEWTPAFRSRISGSLDAFVAVLSSDGLQIKAFTYYGGEQDDRASAVGVNPAGQIIIIGETQSPNLAMSTGSYSQIYSANIDGFIAVFNTSLTILERSTYINGSGDEVPNALVIDVNGGIFVCGTTTSSTGFPTPNGVDRTYNGGKDGFVLKFAPALSILQFSTYFGSESDDIFTALHLTNDGALAVTGSTTSPNYETYPKVNQLSWWTQRDRPYDWTYNGGATDAVLTIFSREGAQIVASTFFGGSGADVGKAVLSDSRGRLIVIGESTSIDLPIVGGLQSTPRGGIDVMAALFTANGRSLVRSTYFGGSGNETVSKVIPETDDIWTVVGNTTSRDFPALGAAATAELNGGKDGFIAKIGIAVAQFCTTIGWSRDEDIHSFVTDGRGDVILAGSTTSPVITLANSELLGVADKDALVVKWAFGTLALIAPRGGERVCVGQSLNVRWNTVDMTLLEKFTIEYSYDEIAWTNIASGVTGYSYTWWPKDNDADIRNILIRVKTVRGHVSYATDLMRVDRRVTIEPLPSDFIACLGRRFEIKTQANGVGLKYSWRKNGQTIAGNGTTYVVDTASLASQGRYESVVTGLCGQVAVSNSMNVSVSSAPFFTRQPQNTFAAENTPVEMSIDGSNADRYSWHRTDQTQEVGLGKILRFQNVRLADAGSYWCNSHGACGSVSSDTVALLVQPVSVQDGDPSLQAPCGTIIVGAIFLYNAIGSLVYSTTGQDLDWCSYKELGARLPAGAYYALGIGSHGQLHRSRFIIFR